jgi:hypothetical protein
VFNFNLKTEVNLSDNFNSVYFFHYYISSFSDKLQNDIAILKQDHQGALSQMKESNERAMIEMSEQYKAKLIVEYQKYSGLEEMYTSIKKSYDKKMSAVEKATKVFSLLNTLNMITTVT